MSDTPKTRAESMAPYLRTTMTTDQIKALEPGREADRLVSQAIYGSPPISDKFPHYSTDHAAALDGLDEFVRARTGWSYSIEWDERYEAFIFNERQVLKGTDVADTRAMAIVRCLMLAAMGGEK